MRSEDARQPCVGMLPWPDRFEDFHDRIGVSFEAFRDSYTGSWLFNYVEALHRAGVRVVLYHFSLRIREPLRFTHGPTGAPVRILPSPWLHRKVRGAKERYRPRSELLHAAAAYVATPLRPLARELRADGCGAILCQEYEYARFDVAVGLGRLLRLPVFATFQGGDRTRHPLERPLRRVAVRRCAGLVIASQVEAARVRKRYGVPAGRIAAIPNPLDVERWRPQDRAPGRAELGIPPAARVVTWQGRVSIDQKGLDVLMEAWPKVCAAAAGHTPVLLLVGDGQDAPVLRRLVDAAPAGTVHWVDRFVMDREVLWRYLTAADIAVLPSRREGFPVALVEAMAAGLPAVAADAPGVIDALGHGEQAAGLVVPVEDADALASALARLVTDEDLCGDLGAQGRRRAQARFSLDAVGAQLRTLLWPASPRDRRATGR